MKIILTSQDHWKYIKDTRGPQTTSETAVWEIITILAPPVAMFL